MEEHMFRTVLCGCVFAGSLGSIAAPAQQVVHALTGTVSQVDDRSKTKGAYVIVFYYGDNDDRAAVALKNLGAGPFTSTEGAVVKFESKAHSISIKDSAGAVQTFKITDQTVAEGYMGAVDGYKFQPQKGDQVRVVAT